MNISRDNYVTILGFMVISKEEGGLELSGTELIAYAVLYGFTQDGVTWFTGTQNYLAEWCGSTTRTIRTALKSLIDKGYIEKREKKIRNIVLYDYRVTSASVSGGAEKFSSVTEKSSDHIYIDNYTTPSDISSNEDISSPPKGETSRKFQIPTIQEIRLYCADKGYDIDAEEFWNFYQSKGWKVGNAAMKDWHAALVTWDKRKKKESNNQTKAKSESGYQMKRVSWKDFD